MKMSYLNGTLSGFRGSNAPVFVSKNTEDGGSNTANATFIQGTAVNSGAPVNGAVLAFDGTEWIPEAGNPFYGTNTATNKGTTCVTIGANADTATGVSSIALGTSSVARGAGNVAVGAGSSATGLTGIALGANASTNGVEGAISICASGVGANCVPTDNFAIALAINPNSVATFGVPPFDTTYLRVVVNGSTYNIRIYGVIPP